MPVRKSRWSIEMSKLFEETKIKNLTIENRFVGSATWDGLATEEGACTRESIELLVELARGELDSS
jgi:2,4-dienoyl-CoA reductase-like NADH-dependent reductase (Old Yellow Enzyme family)